MIVQLKSEIKALKVENDINKSDLQQQQIASNKVKKKLEGDINKLISEKQKNSDEMIQ